MRECYFIYTLQTVRLCLEHINSEQITVDDTNCFNDLQLRFIVQCSLTYAKMREVQTKKNYVSMLLFMLTIHYRTNNTRSMATIIFFIYFDFII